MIAIRQPAVAGQFYPARAGKLKEAVDGYLREAAEAIQPAPKAIIAPHAGYIYSGPVAGTAYGCLAQASKVIRRVVLLGPAHWAQVRGLAASSAEAFATPLGLVPIDTQAQETILSLPQVTTYDHAHSREHGLEVQLPFLQAVFSEFSVVPLVVGEATPAEVAEILDRLWGGKETGIVVSSDLSHYHDYETAVAVDRRTAREIESLRPLSGGQACGKNAINGLLHTAQRRGLTARAVDLRNSGDTAGSRDSVVGYGAFVFWE